MNNNGWIKVHRSLLDHPLWAGEKFTKAQAWLDLLLHANHSEGRAMIKGQFVEIGRGQQIRSQVTLAKAWKWNRKTVFKFLKLLENDKMITQHSTHLTTVITICNYSTFQDLNKNDGQLNMQQDGQVHGHGVDKCMGTNNNDNNVNNEINDIGESKASTNCVPYQNIINLYHEILPDLPACKMLTTKRKGQIKQRWAKDMPDIENWKNFFNYVKQSPFLMGLVQPRDDRKPFQADLEWLTKESNFAKIYEGKYNG